MSPALGAAIAALLSLALVGLVRRYALRREVLDHPSERSSHAVPTPRGGGLGVVLAFLAVAGVSLAGPGTPEPGLLLALGATIAVALIGWIDDHRPLAVAPRMLAHLAAAAALAWFARDVPGPAGAVGLVAALWWLFWTVSAINVTNFMDGIDGLIGLQALVFGVHVVVLARGGPAATLGAALAGAAAGFLAWNWAPARIFLGDVGSAAIGYLMALLGVLLGRDAGVPVVAAFLPLYPIFLDAAATLVRRGRAGASLTQAHRDHLYQRLANQGWGHARVSALYGVAAAIGVFVARWNVPAVHPLPTASYFAAVALAGFLLDQTAGRQRSRS